MRVSAYIDGFNLYHALDALEDQRVKWLDHNKLISSLLRPGETLGQVNYFTAVVTWDKSKQQRHTTYLKALRAVGVDVEESNFRKQPKFCFETGRTCKFREEKKTDVAIATTMMTDAFSENCSRMILVTSDSDQVPTVNALRKLTPSIKLTLLYPPRSSKRQTELGNLFSSNDRKEMSVTHLHRCLLPRDVYNRAGVKVATRPSSYGND